MSVPGDFECEGCGFQPGEDALIHGMSNGYCPKCAEPWGDGFDIEEDEALSCPHCGGVLEG